MSPSNSELVGHRPSDADRFQLGVWLVDPGSGEISSGHTVARIEPKAMDVLVYLASHEGEVVSREDLERHVWRGALVGYDAVTSTVIKLRKALDDDAREPRYIATVPKRGYRLLPGVVRRLEPRLAEPTPTWPRTPSASAPTSAPRMSWRRIFTTGLPLALLLAIGVALLNRQEPVQAPVPLVPRTADLPSLAVLPFANLGRNPDEQYFIDGLTEDLIANLSKIAGLRVIARSSAFAFAGGDADPREAAEQLGVRYVLQGSLRRSGERLRVTAKLVDTASSAHLWAEEFDGGAQDLFALQDQVAEGTAKALSLKLTEDERRGLAARPTTHFEAYDDFLRGRMIYSSLSHRENEQARALYRRAIEKDPRFALAYAGLAQTYIDDFRGGGNKDKAGTATEARRLAERAVALDERLPQAHFAVGYVDLYGLGDHEAAIARAHRALELNPNFADAYALLSSAYFFGGELDKVFELDQEAMRLNPAASFLYHVHLGRRDYLEGRYQEALDTFLIAAAKDANYLPTHVWLAATYAKLGDRDSAEWSAEQVRTLEPGFSVEEWVGRWPFKKPEHRALLISGLEAAGLD
jgi:TolB-like protein/DNA-binding winged helix-turn-helix (wHTH) protein/Tfp pilus assembly protein PilF